MLELLSFIWEETRATSIKLLSVKLHLKCIMIIKKINNIQYMELGLSLSR